MTGIKYYIKQSPLGTIITFITKVPRNKYYDELKQTQI